MIEETIGTCDICGDVYNKKTVNYVEDGAEDFQIRYMKRYIHDGSDEAIKDQFEVYDVCLKCQDEIVKTIKKLAKR